MSCGFRPGRQELACVTPRRTARRGGSRTRRWWPRVWDARREWNVREAACGQRAVSDSCSSPGESRSPKPLEQAGRKAREPPGGAARRGPASGSAGDLAGLEAAGAHVEALGGAVDLGAHALDVGVEATLGDLAGPRPVVAEARALGADVADGSHRELLGVIRDQIGGPDAWPDNRASVSDARWVGANRADRQRPSARAGRPARATTGVAGARSEACARTRAALGAPAAAALLRPRRRGAGRRRARRSTRSTSTPCPTATPAPTSSSPSRRPHQALQAVARTSRAARRPPTLAPSIAAYARGLLLGARGNSGVIMSQLVGRALPPRCDRLRPGRAGRGGLRGRHGGGDPGRLRGGGRARRGHDPHRRAGCVRRGGPRWCSDPASAQRRRHGGLPHGRLGGAAAHPRPARGAARAGVVDAGGRVCAWCSSCAEAAYTGRRELVRQDVERTRRALPVIAPAAARRRPERGRSGLRGDVPARRRRTRRSPRCGSDWPRSATPWSSSAATGCGTSTCTSTTSGPRVEAGIEAGRPYRIRVTHFAEQVAAAPADAAAARAPGSRRGRGGRRRPRPGGRSSPRRAPRSCTRRVGRAALHR